MTEPNEYIIAPDPSGDGYIVCDENGVPLPGVHFDKPGEVNAAYPDARVAPAGWVPGETPPPAEGEAGGNVATPTVPLLPLNLVPFLDQWNTWFGKEYGNITKEQAAMARAYEYLDFGTINTPGGFQTALSRYANWRNGDPNTPAPTPEALKAWAAQQPVTQAPAGAVSGAPMGRRGLEEFAPPTEAPAPNNPLGKAIWEQTAGLDPVTRDRVRSAMLLGAGLEGGGVVGPWGAGDNGTSFGPFQISGLTQAEAEDVNRAVQFMLYEHVGGQATYIKAVQAIPDEIWNSDPQGAATLAIANAERVGGWHEGLTVDEAVTIYGGRDRLTTKGQETGGGGAAPGTAAPGMADVPAYPTPGAPALELTDEERGFNAAKPTPLRDTDLLHYKEGHPELSGKALVDTLYDAYHTLNPREYPLSTEEADIAEYKRQNPIAASQWSDDDWRFVMAKELTKADIDAAVAAKQTPADWQAKSLQDFTAFLKTNKLTLQEFQQASKIISDAEMQDAIAWGTGNPGYMKEYIEARRQGLGHGDIQRGYVAGESPLQTTVRIQTELAKEAETARLTAAREEALKGPEYQTGVGAEIAAEVRRAPTGTPIDVAVSNALGPRIEAEIGDIKAARERRWQEYQQDRYWHGAGPGGMRQFFSGAGGFWGLGGPPGLPPAISWSMGRDLQRIFSAATPEQRIKAYQNAGFPGTDPSIQRERQNIADRAYVEAIDAGQTPAEASAASAAARVAAGTPAAQARVITHPTLLAAQRAQPELFAQLNPQYAVPAAPRAAPPATAAARAATSAPPAGAPTQRLGASGWGYNTAIGRWEYLGMPAAAPTAHAAPATPAPGPAPIDWTKWKPWAQTAAAAATPQPATAEARAYGGLAMMRRGTSKKAPAAAGFRKRKASGLTAL